MARIAEPESDDAGDPMKPAQAENEEDPSSHSPPNFNKLKHRVMELEAALQSEKQRTEDQS